MKGTLLFAQSGGPTAVINASAAGVIRRAQQCGFSKILCARYGIDGILKKQLYDVTHMTESQLRLLADTPASAFGSCRLKLPDPDVNSEIYLWIEEVFRQYDVRCFVYNGGNDSMDTCNKVARYFKKSRYDCAVIGVTVERLRHPPLPRIRLGGEIRSHLHDGNSTGHRRVRKGTCDHLRNYGQGRRLADGGKRSCQARPHLSAGGAPLTYAPFTTRQWTSTTPRAGALSPCPKA